MADHDSDGFIQYLIDHSMTPQEERQYQNGEGMGRTRSGSYGPAAEMAARARDGVATAPVPPTIWQRLAAAWAMPGARSLPVDSNFRKEIPLASGCYEYFPAALVALAAWSKVANEKHNPGEPMHHARGKSADHADCIARHALDQADAERANDLIAQLEEATCKFWRAGADCQLIAEKLGAPLAPRARVPQDNGGAK